MTAAKPKPKQKSAAAAKKAPTKPKPKRKGNNLGGRRPGAGRPKGAKGKATIEREQMAESAIQKAKAAKLQPIDVMLTAMEEHHKEWAQLKEIQDRMQEAKAALSESAKYAQMAAPYVHPRLNSVDVSGTLTYEDMSDAELEQALFAALGIDKDSGADLGGLADIVGAQTTH